MELDKAIRERRSVRVFSDRHVEQEKIEKMIDSARWAPSACNQQLWNFIVIRNDRIKRSLAEDAACNTLVVSAPVVIAVTYAKENLKDYYVSQSASAAVQNMLLCGHELGIGTCWLCGIGSEKEIKRILNIPKDQFVVCLVLAGYQKHESVFVPKRKPVSEIMHINRYSAKEERYLTSHNPEKWSFEQIRRYCDITSVKTEPGSVMDVANRIEKKLARSVLQKYQGKKIVDIFSYDGSFLDCFSSDGLFSAELSDNTARYSEKATEKNVTPILFDDLPKLKERFDICSILFKLERFSKKDQARIVRSCRKVLADDGRIVIMFRNRPSLYSIAYLKLKLFLGDDIKKTALYSFFGPYKPMSNKEAMRLLGKSGFAVVSMKRYFLLPPIIEDIFQLFIQFLKSEKTNFVHRMWHNNIISRAIRKILKWQGISSSIFGSCTVIIAKKKPGDRKGT
jgi:nitroreductase